MSDAAKLLLIAGFLAFLLLGLLGAFVGRMRQHGIAGFWLGFLLGPLGVVVAALLPDDRTRA